MPVPFLRLKYGNPYWEQPSIILLEPRKRTGTEAGATAESSSEAALLPHFLRCLRVPLLLISGLPAGESIAVHLDEGFQDWAAVDQALELIKIGGLRAVTGEVGCAIPRVILP